MDYKDLIKSRKTRIKILQLLSFVPDKLMLKIQYRIKTGHKLNLKNPQRLTEKLQWYKLNHRDPLMAQCVDKYDVREYVKSCGLEHILNEVYGVYDSPSEVDFSSLPNSFVIKDTLGGGGNAVILVLDKYKMDEAKVRKQMQDWVDEPIDKKNPGREWVYDGRKHRVIIEKLIDSNKETGGLIDYKFFCFQGKVVFIYVMGDRKVGDRVSVTILNRDFQILPVKRVGDELFQYVEKPNNYEKLLEVAEKLAQKFPHVRVDLYNENEKILFGELTFYNASGYMKYEPDEFDYDMGTKFEIKLKV